MTGDADGATADPRLVMLADHAGRALARQAARVDEQQPVFSDVVRRGTQGARQIEQRDSRGSKPCHVVSGWWADDASPQMTAGTRWARRDSNPRHLPCRAARWGVVYHGLGAAAGPSWHALISMWPDHGWRGVRRTGARASPSTRDLGAPRTSCSANALICGESGPMIHQRRPSVCGVEAPRRRLPLAAPVSSCAGRRRWRCAAVP